MDSPSNLEEKPRSIILQDVAGDTERAEHQPHDHAADVAHAWEHFRENAFFFGGLFLPVILLTVIAFSVDFGSSPIVLTVFGHAFHLGTGNLIATLILAAARSGLIAYFLSTLFKNFSFVFRTLFFTLVFLGGMIFLSLWDSEVMPGVIGDPIYNYKDPQSMKP